LDKNREEKEEIMTTEEVLALLCSDDFPSGKAVIMTVSEFFTCVLSDYTSRVMDQYKKIYFPVEITGNPGFFLPVGEESNFEVYFCSGDWIRVKVKR